MGREKLDAGLAVVASGRMFGNVCSVEAVEGAKSQEGPCKSVVTEAAGANSQIPIERPSCPKCGRRSAKDGKQECGKQRYCCTKCKIKFVAEYKDYHKEGNPNWKGDDITEDSGRDRARRWFPAPKGYDRHHVDGNPKNNDPSNIKIVKRKAHMIDDGRLEKLRAFNYRKWRASS